MSVSDLPPELLEEIVSHLDMFSTKYVSLTSSTLRAICFPHIFRTLSLFGQTTTFLADFKRLAPTPCFHTLKMYGVPQDLSTGLLPWCTKVLTAHINNSNAAILPSLPVLNYLKLSNMTFWVVDDYFKLLANLPPTLKKLRVRRLRFEYHQSWPIFDNTVGRGVRLEHLETDSLSLLLRDGCPISLKSLRRAYVPQCHPNDLEHLIQRTPHLTDLRLDISTPEERPGTYLIASNCRPRAYTLPVSLPLTTLKSLSITDRTEFVDPTIQLLSAPSSIPSALEVLTITFPLNGKFENLAGALSQPKFRNLKRLNLQITRTDHCFYVHGLLAFSEQTRRFKGRLEELGMLRRIDFTTNLVVVPDIIPRLL
ncbi:hypothetical protein EDD85DRAFT_959678 [Armillaria nabsnona]|nr:hypothetical protein EDD85DRAFT_959678 [Armillaria nabsnona]